MKRIGPLIAALAAAAPLAASSPVAWSVLAKAERAACLKASGLRAATASPAVGFSDATGYDALLVRGIWPQRHMKGARGTMLCLYHRRTKRVEAIEAKGWTAP